MQLSGPDIIIRYVLARTRHHHKVEHPLLTSKHDIPPNNATLVYYLYVFVSRPYVYECDYLV